MSFKAIYVFCLLVLSIISGCATVTPDQKAKWNETIPVCYSDSDCDSKWSAARQWVQSNSGYKIQIYSDDLIETYNPQQYDPKIAVSVSKNPVGKTSEGEQINIIAVKINCGNIFGCIPTVNDAIMSFNNFVSQAEINDPSCYQDMLDSLDKPKLGIYPQFYNNSKFVIKRVCSDSPASRGGMKPNDVITRIAGNLISTEKELSDALAEINFGQEVKVEILRNDSPQVLTIEIPPKNEIESLMAKKDEPEVSASQSSLNIEQKLEALSRLLSKGIINEDEFNAKKEQLLSEM